MKSIVIILLTSMVLFGWHTGLAQKYTSRQSFVHFFSDAPVEDIEATNTTAKSALDLNTREIVFSVPIKSFIFEKSLMQEHFNENYLESDKYPTATFKGKITGYMPEKMEWQSASAIGNMLIHGVEKSETFDGKIRIMADSVFVEAIFPIALKDYNIRIPKVVFYNIAEIIEVTVKFSYAKID
ncbi:MAG: YceI family protein [Cyclobacteriaceae bacterium]|nr:YceI family protein [Cyclobacteriaceae bacterium]